MTPDWATPQYCTTGLAMAKHFELEFMSDEELEVETKNGTWAKQEVMDLPESTVLSLHLQCSTVL